MKKIALISALSLCLFNFNANAKTQKYTLDPYHANVTWKVSHFGFSNPSGKFMPSSGVLNLDEKNPEKSSVEIVIDSSSLSTGNKLFDEHLSAEAFFNSQKHKQITFKSTKIEKTGEKTAKIYGNLTLLGVTKPVVLDATLNKIAMNDFIKKQVAGFSATTKINRSEFGMTQYIPAVADEVFIDIEVEFNKNPL